MKRDDFESEETNMMVEAKLQGGVIFGDPENEEYVYLPGSEIGASRPLCVYEAAG